MPMDLNFKHDTNIHKTCLNLQHLLLIFLLLYLVLYVLFYALLLQVFQYIYIYIYIGYNQCQRFVKLEIFGQIALPHSLICDVLLPSNFFFL